MLLENKWLVLKGWKGNVKQREGSCRLQYYQLFFFFFENWSKNSPTGNAEIFTRLHLWKKKIVLSVAQLFCSSSVTPLPYHKNDIWGTSEMPCLGIQTVMFSHWCFCSCMTPPMWIAETIVFCGQLGGTMDTARCYFGLQKVCEEFSLGGCSSAFKYSLKSSKPWLGKNKSFPSPWKRKASFRGSGPCQEPTQTERS